VATRKSATSRSTKTTTARTRRTTRRTTASSTRRRTSSGSLYPRRRASRPGLPTTVGTAIGTLVVTTLLDLSWPMRLLLIGVVLVLGLAYVLWRHRTEIAAGAATPDAPAAEGTGPVDGTAPPENPTPPSSPPTTPA
jgi:Flp pilus assembly protein TadB